MLNPSDLEPLTALARGIRAEGDGIQFAGVEDELSYPEEGNELCFAIEDSSFWFQHRNRCIAVACEQFVPERFVVDVGGGNGVVAHYLRERGFRTVLVEPGRAGCLNARGRGLKEIVCGTLQSANFRPASLPALGLFDVLEHVERDADFVQDCANVLQPGGKLLLTVPAYTGLWSGEDDFAGHFRRYRIDDLERLLASQGFQVAYATYFFSLLVPAIAFGRVLPYRLGHQGSGQSSDFQRDHASNASRLIGRCLEWEIPLIRHQRRIPVGSSCLVVAVRS